MRRACTARRALSSAKSPITALQLREKQKARRIYGVQERQFRRYFRTRCACKGMTGVTLLQNPRAPAGQRGLPPGPGRFAAPGAPIGAPRSFPLNGHNHNVPSYLVKIGDVIEVRPAAGANGYFKDLADRLGERACRNGWSLTCNRMAGRVVAMPDRQAVDIPLNEQLIVEYYSR